MKVKLKRHKILNKIINKISCATKILQTETESKCKLYCNGHRLRYTEGT